MGRHAARRYRELLADNPIAELPEDVFSSVLQELQSFAELTIELFLSTPTNHSHASEPSASAERLQAQAELLATECRISLAEANRLVQINQQINGVQH